MTYSKNRRITGCKNIKIMNPPSKNANTRPVSAQFNRNDKVLESEEALENIKLYNNDFPDSFGNKFKQMRIGAFVKGIDIEKDLEDKLKDKENRDLKSKTYFTKVNKQDLKESEKGDYLLLNLKGTAKQQTNNGAIVNTKIINGIKVIPQQGGFRNVVSNPENYYYIHKDTFAQNTIKPENAEIFIKLLETAFYEEAKTDGAPYKVHIKPVLCAIRKNLANKTEENKKKAAEVLTSLLYHLAHMGYAVISFHEEDIGFIVEKLKNNDNSKAVVIKLVNESGGEIIQTFEERLTKVEDEQKKQENDINKLLDDIKNLQKVIDNYETRIENLENGNRGEKGEKGEKGDPGLTKEGVEEIKQLRENLKELQEQLQNLQNGKDGRDGRDGRDGENGLNEEINKLIERIKNLESGKSDPEEIRKAIKEFFIKIFNNEPKNKEDEKLQKDIIGFILRLIEENGGKIVGGDNIKEVINNFIDNLDGEQTKKLAERLKGYLVNINLNNDNNFNFNKELWEEHKKNNEHLRQKNDQLLKLLLEKQQKPKIINNYYGSNTSPSEQPNQEEDNEPKIREQDDYRCNDMPIVPKPASGQSHKVTNTTDSYTTNAKKECLCPNCSHVVEEFVPPCKRWYGCACHAHICNYHQQKLNQLEKEYYMLLANTALLLEQHKREYSDSWVVNGAKKAADWIEKVTKKHFNPSNRGATRTC
ncbi:MAG: hypothetical protein J6C50_00880 [Rickettsiales bacterium]|nr:hypothetical protein [Rickettsiales bacterium]